MFLHFCAFKIIYYDLKSLAVLHKAFNHGIMCNFIKMFQILDVINISQKVESVYIRAV